MPICYQERKQICFEDQPGDDDNWLRADVDLAEARVMFDRGGLCKLDAAECLQLAAWLTARAAELPPPPEPKPAKRKLPGRRYTGRHNSRRQTADSAA